MQRIEKSRTSFRQKIRNPSGRMVIGLFLAAVVIFSFIFGRGEWNTISTNLENRPKLKIRTPAPPVVVWSIPEGTQFFTDYAMAHSAPAEQDLDPEIVTCWDYVMSQTGEPPRVIGYHSPLSTESVSLGVKSSVWSVLAGEKVWRFWENTREVHGPC
jgi:hypothetical protein